MRSILIGAIFIFLRLDIKLGDAVIGLLPTFVGYIFVLKGLNNMSQYNNKLVKMRPAAVIMLILNLITYILALMNIPSLGSAIYTSIQIARMLISYFVYFVITAAISEMERSLKINMNGKNIRIFLIIMFVIAISSYAVITVSTVSSIISFVSVAAALIFMFQFGKAVSAFEEYEIRTTENK